MTHNPRINAISRLVYQMAGGAREYYLMSSEERKSLRRIAGELHDRDVSFESVATTIAEERRGFVYVITNPVYPGFVKIGKACRPQSRVEGLNTSCPYRGFRVEYQQFFEEALTVEREVHSNNAHIRADGEWFRMSVLQARAEVYRAWLRA